MNVSDTPSIAFLGTGSMSGAILAGLVQQREKFGSLSATTRSEESAAKIASDGVEAVALAAEPDANRRLAAAADVVVLGVKPYQIVELLREISDALRSGTIVVSVAAGITTAVMEAEVGDDIAVVRVMPNTPSHVGLGVAGIAAGTGAGEGAVDVTRTIFGAVGTALVIDESQIDALSSISGSGPAYVFLFIEQWTRVALELGFDERQAAAMVQGTFRGASELLAASDVDPAELRRRVTSPKGTTEQALAVLQGAGLDAVFREAADAAIARAKELAAE
ncbi:pyrroline-5-carboxylate reductase [uncultured Agrococcus sp.]|uniref:pyrroline-5-carboxylate reductase n=1 Tax=uncultured Agrococcus sp. TaxID=382258 RepID=UPI0025FAB4E1|nr:pyrroline-5-carboxylate reductase [uncultured Agrococcus sp.]